MQSRQGKLYNYFSPHKKGPEPTEKRGLNENDDDEVALKNEPILKRARIGIFAISC